MCLISILTKIFDKFIVISNSNCLTVCIFKDSLSYSYSSLPVTYGIFYLSTLVIGVFTLNLITNYDEKNIKRSI